jgi:outer membrane protein assembly factor BamB
MVRALALLSVAAGALCVALFAVDIQMAHTGGAIPSGVISGARITAEIAGAVAVVGWFAARRRGRVTSVVSLGLAVVGVAGTAISVAVIQPHDARPTVVALDPSTGATRWTARPPTAGVDTFTADASTVTAHGYRTVSRCNTRATAVRYSTTGRYLGKSDDPEFTPPNVANPYSPHDVTLADIGLHFVTTIDPTSETQTLAALDVHTGHTVWTTVIANGQAAVPLVSSGGDVVVLTGMEAPVAPTAAAGITAKPPFDTGPAVTVVDARTGRELWNEPSGSGSPTSASSAAATADAVYLFRGQSLIARDLHSGAVLLTHPVAAPPTPYVTARIAPLDDHRVLLIDPASHSLTLYAGPATQSWSVREPSFDVGATASTSSLILVAGGGKTAYTCGGE